LDLLNLGSLTDLNQAKKLNSVSVQGALQIACSTSAWFEMRHRAVQPPHHNLGQTAQNKTPSKPPPSIPLSEPAKAILNS